MHHIILAERVMTKGRLRKEQLREPSGDCEIRQISPMHCSFKNLNERFYAIFLTVGSHCYLITG